MTTTTLTHQQPAIRFGWQEKVVIGLIGNMPKGGLCLRYSDGHENFFGEKGHPVEATIQLYDDREFFRRCVDHGNIGIGEAYVDGVWDTPDICAVITWFIRNINATLGKNASSGKLTTVNRLSFFSKWFHFSRRNNESNSRRNISEHYDLGNAFYELFLDKSMTYSSALFMGKDDTLEQGQFQKYDALCKKINLQPGDHVLEIGCGWGGFACHAAEHYGAQVTGVTISKEQHQYACNRVKAANLDEQVDLRLQDYRKVTGTFDHIVSIEMLEAVGDSFLEPYFAKCSEVLKPEGMLALQIITVPDCRYSQIKRGVDFIQRHIFPGSLLLSVGRINKAMEKTGTLSAFQIDDMGLDYARTLSKWHQRFNQQLGNVRQMGFDNTFIRKWNYYLKYCEAAFSTRNISVIQAVYTRPNNESHVVIR